MRTTLALTCLLFWLAIAVSAQGAVRVVDATGATGSFTVVQDAIDAAADGDTVLVSAGVYGTVTIDGRDVFLAAEPEEPVVIGDLVVSNVGASQRVAIVGIDVTSNLNIVTVTDCAGAILFQDCEIFPTAGTFQLGSAVIVTNSAAVTFIDSRIEKSLPTLLGGGSAITSTDSAVYVHRCVLQGAELVNTTTMPSAPGLFMQGGFALVVDTVIRGGDGADAFLIPFTTTCQPGGDGGPGARLIAGIGAPELVTVGTTFTAGAGGGPGFTCGGGVDGVPMDVVAGTHETPAVSGRGLTVTGVAPDQSFANFRFTGLPFDFAWQAYGFQVASPISYDVNLTGVSFLAAGAKLVFRGRLDAQGERTVELFLDDLGAPVLNVFQQGLFFGDEGVFVVSNPALTLALGDI